MKNLNLLCQTIRFQRTALQNSLAMISAVQQHGEKLLKTTLDQSPWIPGQGKDAVIFWAGIWRKSLRGATDMVDKNLATMERLASPGVGSKASEEQPAESSVEKAEPAQRQTARKVTSEKKQTVEKQQTEAKGSSSVKAAEPAAMEKIEAEKPQTTEQPAGKQQEKKKPKRQKLDRAGRRRPLRRPSRKPITN